MSLWHRIFVGGLAAALAAVVCAGTAAASDQHLVFHRAGGVADAAFTNCTGAPEGTPCTVTSVYATSDHYQVHGRAAHQSQCVDVESLTGTADGYGGVNPVGPAIESQNCTTRAVHWVAFNTGSGTFTAHGTFRKSLCQNGACVSDGWLHVDVSGGPVGDPGITSRIHRYRSKTSGRPCVGHLVNLEPLDGITMTGAVTGLGHPQGSATGSGYEDVVTTRELGPDQGCLKWVV